MHSRALAMIFPTALASVLFGCGNDTGDTSREVVLSFQAMVGATSASCTETYSGLGSSSTEAQLADARLFVSQLELHASSGEWVRVELDDSNWQREGVALLDFEDATGSCADSGTSETNTTVTGVVPEGSYDSVRFRVGVPFELNHVDNATAPPPFNVPGMYWTWQGGYKFLRVDWIVNGGAVPRWNVHIGSTGCSSSAPTEAPTVPCSRPNTSSIEVGPFDLENDIIGIDLASLVEPADLAANATDTPPGCMSNPGEPEDCTPVYSSLGLKFDDGSCIDDCGNQTTFYIAQ